MNSYLKELVSNENTPIVFDYDGVLFEARWYEKRINMPNETDEKLLESMKKGENLKTAPIPMMVDWVKTLKNPLFVLSHMHNEIEYEFKQEQIRKYYPNIPRNHVLMATSVEDKISRLKQIKNASWYDQIIYIDDNHQALIRFENYFDDTYKFFHVSSLYVSPLSK